MQLIAQLEKIISCGESLEGDKFKKTLTIAKEKYGVYRDPLANRESINDIRAKEIKPLKFYIDNLVAEQQRIIIAGDNETLKTMLALNMAVAIQCGIPQLFENTDKFPITKTNALYIDAEKITRARDIRLKQMVENKDLNYDTDIFINPDEFDLAEADSRFSLEQIIKNEEVKVLIIDSITAAWSGDENDKVAVGELTQYFTKLIDKFKVSIVLIKHWKKPQGDKKIEAKHMIAGSYGWSGWADNIICMAKNASKQVVVSQEKNRSTGSKFDNFIIEPNSACWLKYVGDFSADERTSGEEVRPLFEKVGKTEVTIAELESAAKALSIDLNAGKIRTRLQKAIDAGIVQKVNKNAPNGMAGIFKLTGKTEDSIESADLFIEEVLENDS